MDKDLKEIEKLVIGDLWANNGTYNNVATVCDSYGSAFPGTISEVQHRKFLEAKFKEYGLGNVNVEPFKYLGWLRGNLCKLEVLEPVTRELEAVSLPGSPSTPPEGVEGEVCNVGWGTLEDFEDKSKELQGRIALVKSGGPPGRALYRIAQYIKSVEKGASAFIFMNSVPGQLITTGVIWAGRGRKRYDIPAVGVSLENGSYILRQIAKGGAKVKLTLTGNEVRPDTTSWNIVGDIPGYKYPDEVILVGAHWDGHDIAQGALDNTLGIFGILEVARALSPFKGKFKRTLRFVAFGVEEFNCCGSQAYAEQHRRELDKVNVMINCDGFARSGSARISVASPKELTGYLRKVARVKNIPIDVGYEGHTGSDATAFWLEGVPTISFGGTRSAEAAMFGRGGGWDHGNADTVDKLDEKRIRTAQMKLAQFLISMADEEEPFAKHLTRETVEREIEKLKMQTAIFRPPFDVM